MKLVFHSGLLLALGLAVLLSGQVETACAEEADPLLAGHKAFSDGKYAEAEQLFGQVVAKAPDDYKALRVLAETKIKLKKFAEAEGLVDRILKMPVVKGRNVMVIVEGDPQPHEAEIVDERVMAVDATTGKAREFELLYTLAFSVRMKDGIMLIAPEQLTVRRNYVFDPTAVIGATQNVDALRRDMRRDAAGHIIRTLEVALGE